MNTLALIALIIFILWIIVATLTQIRDSIPIETYRAQAKKQFLEYRTHSTISSLIFIGAESELLKSTEDIVNSQGFIESYSLTCYARNTHGEYFMFVSSYDGQPFCKHISHTNARIILGDQYQESNLP